jgi:hypothetical protein
LEAGMKKLATLIIIATVVLVGCVTTDQGTVNPSTIEVAENENPSSDDTGIPGFSDDWNENLKKYNLEYRGPSILALIDKETGKEYEIERPQLPDDWATNLDDYEVESRGSELFVVDKETGLEFEGVEYPWFMTPEKCELSVREDALVFINVENGDEYPVVTIDANWTPTDEEGYTLDVTMSRIVPFINTVEFEIHFPEKRYALYGGGTSRTTRFEEGDSTHWYFEDKVPRYPVEKFNIGL